MTDREFKAIIDELWNTFWSSGISNPISVVEQMTYLIFFKMFDMQEQQKDRKAKHFKKERHGFFEGRENLRWHNLIQETDPNKLLKTYREKVFNLFVKSICFVINF